MSCFRLALVCLLVLSSCAPVQQWRLRSIGIFDEKVSPVHFRSSTKWLVFLPMHHIGKPAFYAHTRQLIDSLHRQGYVVLYESVYAGEHTSRAQLDTFTRKYRKIMGAFSTGGYLDTATFAINGRRYGFLKGLINQPHDADIGLNLQIDTRADADVAALMHHFEQRFGTVPLSACDWATPIGAPYSCKKAYSNAQRKFFTSVYRNQLLANEVMRSPATKIVVLYGANHCNELFRLLRSSDSSWRRNSSWY